MIMTSLHIQKTGHVPDTGLHVTSLTIVKTPIVFTYGQKYGPGKDITFDNGMEFFLRTFQNEAQNWTNYSNREKLYLTLQWLKGFVTFYNQAYSHVTLSQVMKQGRGVCRHITLLYLIFLKEIGIQGVFLTSGMGTPPKNIHKPDGSFLFHNYPLNSYVKPHAWAEVLINDSWIPVDPTIDFIGDTPEKIEVFHNAGYQAKIAPFMTTEPHNLYGDIDIPPFQPQQKQATGKVIVKPVPQINWNHSSHYQQTAPYQGNFKLEICPFTYDQGMQLLLHEEPVVSAHYRHHS